MHIAGLTFTEAMRFADLLSNVMAPPEKLRGVTPEQWKALLRLFARQDRVQSFDEFAKDAYLAHTNCVMVQWCNMWIGIEPDGYTHS